jgi:hypothetical protein
VRPRFPVVTSGRARIHRNYFGGRCSVGKVGPTERHFSTYGEMINGSLGGFRCNQVMFPQPLSTIGVGSAADKGSVVTRFKFTLLPRSTSCRRRASAFL